MIKCFVSSKICSFVTFKPAVGEANLYVAIWQCFLMRSHIDNQNVLLNQGFRQKTMIEAFKHVRPGQPLINYPNFFVTTKFKGLS